MKIQFSRWYKWCSIRKRPAVIPNTPGVYIIAEKADPNTVPDPISENVIYIGQSMKLRARLQAFDRTCDGKRGHAGGRTLRASRFNNNPPGSQWESLRNDLSIAFWRPDYDTSPSVPETSIASPENLARDLKQARIRFVEAKLLLDFVLENSQLPECNGGVTRHTRG